jgi:hypothetical protein
MMPDQLARQEQIARRLEQGRRPAVAVRSEAAQRHRHDALGGLGQDSSRRTRIATLPGADGSSPAGCCGRMNGRGGCRVAGAPCHPAWSAPRESGVPSWRPRRRAGSGPGHFVARVCVIAGEQGREEIADVLRRR